MIVDAIILLVAGSLILAGLFRKPREDDLVDALIDALQAFKSREDVRA